MKMEAKKTDFVLAGIIWLALLFSFTFNLFGVGSSSAWFEDFQKDSSLITEKAAVCKGQLHYDGPVIPGVANMDYMKAMASSDCTPANYVPYDSQFGLQARVIAFFAPNGQHIASYFRALEFIMSAVTALILTAVIMRIKRQFGGLAALILASAIALSVWIVGYARNLYWIESLMLAPFATAFVAYSWFKHTNRLWLFYGIETLLVFAKLLDGYEHITTISLSIFVPIVFYELTIKDRRIFDLWKQAALVVGVTLVAFIGAFACNVAALTGYYGSPREAVQHIQRRSTARSLAGLKDTKKDVVLNFEATLPAAYQATTHLMNLDTLKDGHGALIKYVAISAINYLLLPAISLPISINGLFGVLVQSILVWSILGYIAIRLLRQSPRYNQYHRAFHWTYWVSLAGALSWLILMPGHAFPHAHLNGIVFYIPHLLFCYTAIGLAVTDYISVRRALRGKQ
jgi:hypothetical protein